MRSVILKKQRVQSKRGEGAERGARGTKTVKKAKTASERPRPVLGGQCLASRTGAMGEGEAGRYLESKGYRLVAVNWRNPRDRRDELDLVCREGGILVFVEVKTRKAGGLVRGLTALNQRKQLVLRRAIRAYLASLTWRQRPHTYRVDVVEVEYRSLLGGATPALEGVEVFHYEHYPLFHGNSF